MVTKKLELPVIKIMRERTKRDYLVKALISTLLFANACWISTQSQRVVLFSPPMDDFELSMPSKIATTTKLTPPRAMPLAVEYSSLTPRDVSFLRPRDWNVPQKEAYSGMWWQATEYFLKAKWSGMISLETASFRAFGNNRARKTRDWLDLSVTHLSKYWKHFMRKPDQIDTDALVAIEQHLDRYVYNTQPLPILKGSAAPDTLALVPFLAPSTTAKDHLLSAKALKATIASIWQIGISRCVVVVGGGESPETEEKLARSMFESLQGKSDLRPIDLQVIVVTGLTDKDRLNMPQVALGRLKEAMEGSLESVEETRNWLGDKKWKFVYFTEPDLILHVRPSAMPAITAQMIKGSTLSGHRFQPIPHQINFPSYDQFYNVVPNNFASLPDPMDPISEEQSCCDGGRYYPSHPENPQEHISNNQACVGRGAYWWQCGFWYKKKNYTDPSVSRELHHLIANYTLFRIRGGTEFPLIDHHQRVCTFLQNTNCGEGIDDEALDKQPGFMKVKKLFEKRVENQEGENEQAVVLKKENRFQQIVAGRKGDQDTSFFTRGKKRSLSSSTIA